MQGDDGDDSFVRLSQPGLSFHEWAEMQVATGKLLWNWRFVLGMIFSFVMPAILLYALIRILSRFGIELGLWIVSNGEVVGWYEAPEVAAIVACLTIITIALCVRTSTWWIWRANRLSYSRLTSIHGPQIITIREHDIEMANPNGTSRMPWDDIHHRIRGRSGLWYLVNRHFCVFWISDKTIDKSDNPAELRRRLGIA